MTCVSDIHLECEKGCLPPENKQTGKIYTKTMKMWIFIFRSTYSLVCETKKLYDLITLFWGSKNWCAKFLGYLTHILGFTAIFRFFKNKFNSRYCHFDFWKFWYHKKTYLLQQVSRYRFFVFSFISQLICLKVCWNQFLNFCLQNILGSSNSEISTPNQIFTLGVSNFIWVKKSKLIFMHFWFV